MIFAQMLEIVALNDLVSVLSEISCLPSRGGLAPQIASFFIFYLSLLFYYLFIIIFKALRLAAAVFMFFLFGIRRETSALRACFSCPL